LNSQVSSPPDTLFELSEHTIQSSNRIVAHDLFVSQNYCTVHFTVSAIALGSSDGKGLRIDYNQGQNYLFMAIGDDYPINLYDSQGKKSVKGDGAKIKIGQEYEFLVNILPNGIIVSQWNGQEFIQIINYAKSFSPSFDLKLQCQRTGAVFKDIWVKDQSLIKAIQKP
jgi:hypothetical protein